MDREQFDGRHAQPLEVGDFLDQAGKRSGLAHSRGRMAGKAADVQFINDGIFQGNARRYVLAPVKRLANEEAAPPGAFGVGLTRLAPDRAVGEGGRGWVQKNERWIEAVATVLGAIHTPAIAKSRRQSGHQHVPVAPRAILRRVERDFRERSIAVQGIND